MKKIFSILFVLPVLCFSQNNEGWKNLFDGKTLNGWKLMTGKAEYKAENGAIVGTTVMNSPNSFLVSDKKVTGDFVLELEAMITDTASNSGIQFKSNFDPAGNNGQGKIFGYQFEIDPSVRKWSGGIYDEGRREWLYPGSLNSKAQQHFTTGVYHKIRIECFGRETKTWLDGVATACLFDSLLKNEGLIALQVHSISNPAQKGLKLFWKNIRIRTEGISQTAFPGGIYVANLVPNLLTNYEMNDGWKLLFDGKTNKGWVGAYKKTFPEKGWEIKNGVIEVQPSAGGESVNGGDIVTTEKFSAFDFSFEFKLTPGANSGVKYFVTLSENNQGSAIGLEYQLLDDTLHPDAKMGRDGNRTLSSLYDLIKANKQTRFIKQPGNWNTGRIIVYPNNHVEHYLNGVKVLEYERGSQTYRDLVAISKYKVWQNFGEAKFGHILLQDHGNEVSFRSLKIKRLN